MLLYATTTSERASKGQGGNKWICIKLNVQNGDNQNYPVGEIILDYLDDAKNGASQNEWVLKYLSQTKSEPVIIDQGNVEPATKGNQQKINKCAICNKPTDGISCCIPL